MTRVDELLLKYPSLPREVIVKFEVLHNGIKDSEAIDKVSYWDRAGSYQSRDHDVTLKDIAEKRPGTVKPGFVIRPRPLFMKNGVGANITRDSQSLYEIKEISGGGWALFEGVQKVEDIYFPVPPRPQAEEATTSRGTPVTRLIELRGGPCFRIQPLRYCGYFNSGDQCRFCNYNSTYSDARSIGTAPPTSIALEETVEAYTILGSSNRFVDGAFQSGAIGSNQKEARLYIDFVEKISAATSYATNLTIRCQPISRKNMQRLMEAGANCISMQLEVWEPHLFAEICPGKFKRDGYEGYLEAYLEALDVFGVGNVAAAFVGGASLMPANGHQTWQEARDSMVEGFDWTIKNGVYAIFNFLRLGVGSVYGDAQSSTAKLPPTEYYLELAVAHHNLMMDYGLYAKANKLLWCPLDSAAYGYLGDIGWLALAGDIGHWAADAFPEETNWLAKFISSVA